MTHEVLEAVLVGVYSVNSFCLLVVDSVAGQPTLSHG